MAKISVYVITKLCLALAFNSFVSVSSFCAHHRELSTVFQSRRTDMNNNNNNKNNRIHQTTTTTTMMMPTSNKHIGRCNFGITKNTAFKNSLYQEERRRTMFPSSSTSSSRKQQENSLLRRSMYNLPPGGGGNNNKNDIGSIGKSALTVLGIIAFFASPLGGIFFAITNSILLLLFSIPVVAFIAFQVYQKTQTIEAPCPGCGAPTRVVKDFSVDGEGAMPNVCVSCGTFVKSSPDGKSVIDMNANSNSIFNNDVILDPTEDGIYTQQQGGVSSPFESIVSDLMNGATNTGVSSEEQLKEKENQFRREQTIIDVEVTDEDKKIKKINKYVFVYCPPSLPPPRISFHYSANKTKKKMWNGKRRKSIHPSKILQIDIYLFQ